MRLVNVVPYNNNWPSMFREEAKRIRTVFGNELIHIYHIGSTSIPNMSAKPIIDILVVVRHIKHVDYFNTAMQAIGYTPMGEYGVLNRRFFQKGGENRTHHIHVFQLGCKEVGRHLLFRDYIIAHPNAHEEYKVLKEKLAKDYPKSIDQYMAGKDGLIKSLEDKATSWVETVDTAVAFIIREQDSHRAECLAFFTEMDKKRPWAIPGGRIEDGETPEQGVLREVSEESGLQGLSVHRKLGVSYYYRPEKQVWVTRHDFILVGNDSIPSTWQHVVYGEGEDAGENYFYQWLPVEMLTILDEELHVYLNNSSFPELCR